MPLQVHVRVSGKVQGVYYRKWAVEKASKLYLNGWVRNCKDGSVEALFSGKPAAVAAMLEQCKAGPPRARVSAVELVVAPNAAPPPTKGFHQLQDN